MKVTLTRMDAVGVDREELVRFLTENSWPFHVMTRRERAEVEGSIDSGAFRSEDNDTYWIDHAELGRIGFVRFEDLEDATPLFDLRLAEHARGRGLGAIILQEMSRHLFESLPEVRRFEGHTRVDNLAMRRVFQRAGWVKEAHYREAWPRLGDEPLDTVAYALLRRDWESGTTTRIVWDDAR